jgi:SAM-dependent methyltransferase
MELKYFVFAQYVRSRDANDLLARLDEDGAFGCWTFEYPGFPLVSRDLLDSVNELNFLDRQMGLLRRTGLRVLDIGAGYGRMAYRMTQVADVADYCCLDAVPESTFLCDYYLRHRRCVPPARVVPLPDVDTALAGAGFDLALNIHSFSECTFDAVEWWFERLARLRVPYLLIVPNDGDRLLALDPDGTRRDFAPVVAAAGYELCASERVIDDDAASALLRHDDRFLLFTRTG